MYLLIFLFILNFNLQAFGANICLINFEPQYKYYKVNPNTVSTLFTSSDYQIHERINNRDFVVEAHLNKQGYIHFKMKLRYENTPTRSKNLCT